MQLIVGGARLRLIQGDITQEKVDGIVNAANSGLMGGGGVDGAIHRAGGPAILEECKRFVQQRGWLPAGQAVMTTGGHLPARYVIHAVGPVWSGGRRGEAETLASAYRESLVLAMSEGLRTVSFPSISTGAYSFPVDLAAKVALGDVTSMLESGSPLEEVRFVLFDRRTYDAYAGALQELASEKDLLPPAQKEEQSS